MTTGRTGFLLRFAIAVISLSLFFAPAETRAQPKRGGTAVMAVDSSQLAILNTQLTSGIAAQIIADLWADGLYARNGKGQKVPHLATSWTVSDDQLTYTFKLRSGVKWSDGTPFTAADAVFTLQRLAPLNTYMAAVLPKVEAAEAPDATTFVVRLKSPVAAMLEVFNKETFPILPKHIYENGEPAANPANRNPVGLGPFKLQSWEQGRQLVFVRNENFWDQPKPYLDSVVVALIPSPQQQVNALIRGEVDWAVIPFSQVQRAREAAKDGKIDVRRIPFSSPARLSMDFNLRQPPFDNVKVRQALFMATDRKQIAADAYHGLAIPETNVIPAQFSELTDPSVDYSKAFPFDLQAAGKLLDEAGYPLKDGKRFSIELTSGNAGSALGTVYNDAANIIAARWRQVGIEVRLSNLDQAIWLQKVYEKHDFHVSITSLTATFDPTFGIDRSYLCNTTSLAYKNPTGYCNQELEEVAAKANAAKWADRRQFYKRYAEIVARDLSEVTLTNVGQTHGMATRFGNYEAQYEVAFDGYPSWAEVWLK